jgi:hypothetical protein
VKPLAIAVVLASLASPLHAADEPQVTWKSAPVFRGSVNVQAAASTRYEIRVDKKSMKSPRLVGRVTASGGKGNDVIVLVLTEADYVNWRNNRPTRPLYESGQVKLADLSVALPASGIYYVVFSNLFSGMTPKTISGKLDLRWGPTAPQAVAASQGQPRARSQSPEPPPKGTPPYMIMLLGGLALVGALVWMILAKQAKPQGRSGR